MGTHSLTHSQDFTNRHTKSNLIDFRHFRHLIRVMRRHDLIKKYLPTYLPTHLPTYLPTYLCTSIREHPNGAILETLDLRDDIRTKKRFNSGIARNGGGFTLARI